MPISDEFKLFVVAKPTGKGGTASAQLSASISVPNIPRALPDELQEIKRQLQLVSAEKAGLEADQETLRAQLHNLLPRNSSGDGNGATAGEDTVLLRAQLSAAQSEVERVRDELRRAQHTLAGGTGGKQLAALETELQEVGVAASTCSRVQVAWL